LKPSVVRRVTAVVVLVFYFRTLAPEVTLEDRLHLRWGRDNGLRAVSLQRE
jgi:hypothetical protein